MKKHFYQIFSTITLTIVAIEFISMIGKRPTAEVYTASHVVVPLLLIGFVWYLGYKTKEETIKNK